MKSTLKLILASLLLGLPVANLLRAFDEETPAQGDKAASAQANEAAAPQASSAAPVQSGPSIQPDQPPPPDTGEKPQRPHMMNPQRMLQRLSEQVNLTDDQKAKILPLLQAQADQLKALHDDTSLSDDEKHEKMRTIMQSTRRQMGDLLTPEQAEKLKEMRAAHDKDNPPPPPADAPPPPPPGN